MVEQKKHVRKSESLLKEQMKSIYIEYISLAHQATSFAHALTIIIIDGL